MSAFKRSTKIGDIWLCEYLNAEKPHVRIGIWDQDAETTINIDEIIKIRRFLTDIIIKSKQ